VPYAVFAIIQLSLAVWASCYAFQRLAFLFDS